MQRKLIALAAVAFVVGLGVGAAAVTSTVTDAQTTTNDAHAELEEIEVQDGEIYVRASTSEVDVIALKHPEWTDQNGNIYRGDYFGSHHITAGATATGFDINSSYGQYDRGYNVDGTTMVQFWDDEDGLIGARRVNISARLD